MSKFQGIFDIVKGEGRDLILAILVLGFAFSYRDWGVETFNLAMGLQNLFITIVLVACAFAGHEIVHRCVANKLHAKVIYKVYWIGLVLTLVLAIVTNGWFIYAAPGAVMIIAYHKYRIGRRHYHKHRGPAFGPYEKALIAVSGPMTNIGLAILGKILIPYWGYSAYKFMMINVWYGVFNLIPFIKLGMLPLGLIGKGAYEVMFGVKETPRVEGEYVFFGSRLLWFAAFMSALIIGVGLFFFSTLLALIIGLVSTAVLFLIFYYYLEYK